LGEVLFDRLWSVREERKEERKGGLDGGSRWEGAEIPSVKRLSGKNRERTDEQDESAILQIINVIPILFPPLIKPLDSPDLILSPFESPLHDHVHDETHFPNPYSPSSPSSFHPGNTP